MWEHLWMKREDDPEERIRELERPLAETARASEVASSQTPGGPPYSPVTPAQPPLTYGTSSRRTSPRRPPVLWWFLAAFFVIGAISVVGNVVNSAHRGNRVILSPTPSTMPTSAVPSAGGPQSPAPAPSTAPSPAPKAPAGANLVISGINENRTIACTDSAVSISGISNKVVITGHCARVNVSGVQNSVTVDAVDTIDASGFNNKITYHTGSPSIDNSGEQNTVQRG